MDRVAIGVIGTNWSDRMDMSDTEVELAAAFMEVTAASVRAALESRDVQLVLDHLEPAYVTLSPEMVSAAKKGYVYAREMGVDAGMQLALPVLMPLIVNLRQGAPALWTKALSDAASPGGSAKKSAIALSDLMMTGVFRQIAINHLSDGSR